MPLNIDTGWSFGRLILEVAEDAGLADQTGSVAAIPTDAHQLDLIKRAVNKGYQEFIRMDPQWSFRNRSFTITTSASGTAPDAIGGDAGIIRLPRWLARAPETPFEFVDENSVYERVEPVSYARVRGQQQRFPQSGPPEMGCARPIDGDGRAVGQRSGTVWALYLWPTPDAAYTLESSGHVFPYDMVELEERHIAGAEHDETIKAFALKHLHGGPHEDAAKKQACRDEADRQFLISKAADVPARVGVKGLLRDPRMRRRPTGDDIHPGDSSSNLTAYGQNMG